MMYGPLQNYHNTLRQTRMSGYPNVQFGSPHPYQMSMQRPQGGGGYGAWYMARHTGQGVRPMDFRNARNAYFTKQTKQPMNYGFPDQTRRWNTTPWGAKNTQRPYHNNFNMQQYMVPGVQNANYRTALA